MTKETELRLKCLELAAKDVQSSSPDRVLDSAKKYFDFITGESLEKRQTPEQ